MSATTVQSIEEMSLNITQEIHVRASLEATFAALLEQVGPGNEKMDGEKMPMKLEPWPGGRWYRDLGDNNGHFWATVQAIKRPTLLEFSGPLFASYPLVSNVQYRLSEKDGGTLIRFQHLGFGAMPEEHRAGVRAGWAYILEGARKRAEGSAGKSAAGQTAR
ncbi:MAG TPA: SRPBCC domain-containing protein [Candidatus Acidoferrum sp.]|nr:SRPBCC domain-containing protein [Candidatus Acidoferrum sp.]